MILWRYRRYRETRKTDKQTTFVFFVEMARFKSLSDSDLDQILEDRDSKDTKSVIKLAVKVLNDYLIEKNGEIGSVDELDLSDTSVDIVVATLKRFYGEIRKADGTLYAKKSMITLRFGLQKHFLKSGQEDIINSEHYSAANDIFKAVIVKLVKEGKGTVKHKEVILPEDLQKFMDMLIFQEKQQKHYKIECSLNIYITFATVEGKI